MVILAVVVCFMGLFSLKGKINKNYHFVQLLDNSTIISNLGLNLDTGKINLFENHKNIVCVLADVPQT